MTKAKGGHQALGSPLTPALYPLASANGAREGTPQTPRNAKAEGGHLLRCLCRSARLGVYNHGKRQPRAGWAAAAMASTRRLAAILAADVAGYSRLMGTDEEGTLERLKTLRRQLIDPKIAEYHGRIVKTPGDGFLVEFPSVVDAVRCAAEV